MRHQMIQQFSQLVYHPPLQHLSHLIFRVTRHQSIRLSPTPPPAPTLNAFSDPLLNDGAVSEENGSSDESINGKSRNGEQTFNNSLPIWLYIVISSLFAVICILSIIALVLRYYARNKATTDEKFPQEGVPNKLVTELNFVLNKRKNVNSKEAVPCSSPKSERKRFRIDHDGMYGTHTTKGADDDDMKDLWSQVETSGNDIETTKGGDQMEMDNLWSQAETSHEVTTKTRGDDGVNNDDLWSKAKKNTFGNATPTSKARRKESQSAENMYVQNDNVNNTVECTTSDVTE